MDSRYDSDTLAEDFKALERVEEEVRDPDVEYTFGDIRDDLSNTAAETIIHYGPKAVNSSDETLVLDEDTFEFTERALSQTYQDAEKPLGLELGVLAGSAAGLGLSGYQFLESGDPLYLGTGLVSGYAGKKAADRIVSSFSARGREPGAGDHLDVAHATEESYEVKIMDEEELRDYVVESQGAVATRELQSGEETEDLGALGPEEIDEKFD